MAIHHLQAIWYLTVSHQGAEVAQYMPVPAGFQILLQDFQPIVLYTYPFCIRIIHSTHFQFSSSLSPPNKGKNCQNPV